MERERGFSMFSDLLDGKFGRLSVAFITQVQSSGILRNPFDRVLVPDCSRHGKFQYVSGAEYSLKMTLGNMLRQNLIIDIH